MRAAAEPQPGGAMRRLGRRQDPIAGMDPAGAERSRQEGATCADFFARLLQARAKRCRHVLGLISGTSMDGIDVARVAINGSGRDLKLRVLSTVTKPYPASLAERLRHAHRAGVAEIAELDVLVGHAFAAAALEHLADQGVDPTDLDLAGSHGQTVYHQPPSSGQVGTTLQLGDGDLIAQRLGVPTVSDFRRRDMAAGGEGAPLVPYLDALLFGEGEGPRALLNLGGIANVTYLPGSSAKAVGFDTGPGNMVLDALASWATEGRQLRDEDGRLALCGRVDERLLGRLLSHPFFFQALPRSTGREQFGEAFVEWVLREGEGRSPEDLLATATALSARAVAATLRGARALVPEPPGVVIASGGGVHNPALMAALRTALEPTAVRTTAEYGIPVDGKEAVLFAVLANETLCGRAGNLPAVTGASAPVPLGKVSL
ncbi:MAG: anhydro-N-acetylmuramic acid kinase [Planctomycetota bacterium]